MPDAHTETLWSILLGGLGGALLGPFFIFWVEQRRLRGEVAVSTVEWLEQTYRVLEVLTAQLRFKWKGPHEFTRPDEVSEANRDMRKRMVHDALRARVSVAFGEGEELRLLNTFQVNLRTLVFENLWKVGDEAAWEKFDTESKPFTEKLDKVRQQLEARMLRRARLPAVLRWL